MTLELFEINLCVRLISNGMKRDSFTPEIMTLCVCCLCGKSLQKLNEWRMLPLVSLLMVKVICIVVNSVLFSNSLLLASRKAAIIRVYRLATVLKVPHNLSSINGYQRRSSINIFLIKISATLFSCCVNICKKFARSSQSMYSGPNLFLTC